MPRAETAKNLSDEDEIVQFVIAKYPKKYDGYLKISEMLYRLDGVLTQRHPFGYSVPRLFYEAKARDITFGQYPSGYMISIGKLTAARELTAATGLRCCLLARFVDGVIASVDFATCRRSLRIGGRQDRPGFMHDVEPVAVIPWEEFAMLRGPDTKGGKNAT
jgi:hypothetical protein